MKEVVDDPELKIMPSHEGSLTPTANTFYLSHINV